MDQSRRCRACLCQDVQLADPPTDVSSLDAIWHVLNFLAPAGFVGLVTATGAKLVFGRSLRSMAWRRLLLWALVPTALVAIVGLIVTGRDGAMSTYAAMAAASALGAWVGGGLSRQA